VVLEWIGARALVRLDRNERRTEVAVTGDMAEDCQGLFDIIRAHLTVLHGKVSVMEEVSHKNRGPKSTATVGNRSAVQLSLERISIRIACPPSISSSSGVARCRSDD
jgi:hypothetical protein